MRFILAASLGQRAIDDDTAERNRGAGLGLPVLPEIDDLLEALGRVGEAVLVNDQAGVERPVEHRTFDLREQTARVLSVAAGNASDNRKFAVVYLPGMAIFRSPRATSSARDLALRDQQRTAVPPERAAGIEQHVVVAQ